LAASGRTEIRIAGNLVSNSVALAAADGAIYEAIFNLSDPRPERRWPIDGSARRVAIGRTEVILRLEDEASWINPSSASPVLLEALLRISGSDPETARRLAAAIGDWVGSAAVPRPQGALLAEYQAAGLDYVPPGEPLQTLDELNRVVGMTPEIFAAIRPHLTLFGPGDPSPTSNDPVVVAALALAAQAGAGAAGVPGVSQTPPDVSIVRITALASGPGNARIVRFAVIRTGAAAPQGYSVLAWGSLPNTEIRTAPGRPPLTR
jgi:general secretion pathway protein K